MALSSYSSTPASNTTIGGINIAEGCAPSGINDAIRQMMADIASANLAKYNVHGADIASAATLNLNNATGDYVYITGTTTVTAITLSEGAEVLTKFSGAVTLTNGASLILPSAANITTAAGDVILWRGEASGVVRAVSVMLASGQSIVPVYKHGADIASASTVNLDTATGDLVDITGTTTITAITLADGLQRTVRFTGALTLTHGASLVLPSAANITTAAGDYAVFRGYTGGIVRCVSYSKASGAPNANVSLATGVSGTLPIANGGTGVTSSDPILQRVSSYVTSASTGTTIIPQDNTIPQSTEGDQYMTLSITPLSASSKLVIDVVVNLSHSLASQWLTAALFQDSTANATKTATSFQPTATAVSQIIIRHEMTSGTTSSTTFKVRAGAPAAGTTTFNGQGGGGLYGGTMASSITITEYVS